MVDLKLSGILHDDAKIVHDAIILLQGMVDTLERECMIRDGSKPATEVYILINDLKRNVVRLEDISERISHGSDPSGKGCCADTPATGSRATSRLLL